MAICGKAYDLGYDKGYEQAKKDILAKLDTLRIDYGPLRMSSMWNTWEVCDAVRNAGK